MERKVNNLVIGLTGKSGSGKSFAAELLKQHFQDQGFKVEILAFATKLKKDLAKTLSSLPYCPFSEEQLLELFESPEKEKYRPLFQWFGTDFIREICRQDYFWIHELSTQIRKLRRKVDIFIVSDVRFLNEVQFIRSFPKNLLIMLTSPSQSANSSHSSEQVEKLPVDYTVYNPFDPDALRQSLVACLSSDPTIQSFLSR
jgi:ABC-type dipeptide/oligopeptide/nickel transport system ATPase component